YDALKDYPEGLFKVRVDYDSVITGIRVDLYEIQPHRKLGLLETGDFDYPSNSRTGPSSGRAWNVTPTVTTSFF
ncbi:MAG: hypothetical protein LRY55_08825, partial [Leadbetterella sp.]|nr:hypothetical protein [Leadbetterella sp.]